MIIAWLLYVFSRSLRIKFIKVCAICKDYILRAV
jgi:hypothetical protein